MRLTLVLLAGLLFLSPPLLAQHQVSLFAGGITRTGVSANSIDVASLSGMTWDNAGNLIFSDKSNDNMRRVRQDGNMDVILLPGNTDGGPMLPRVDAAGNVYFADYSRILKVIDSKTVMAVAGNGFYPGIDGPLEGPATHIPVGPISDFFFAPDGYMYFCGRDNKNIRRLGSDGTIRIFASLTTQPFVSLTWTAGTLFAATGDGVIRKFAADGSSTIYAGGGAIAAPAADGSTKALDLQIGEVLQLRAKGDGTLFVSRINIVNTRNSSLNTIRIDADGSAHNVAGSDSYTYMAIDPVGRFAVGQTFQLPQLFNFATGTTTPLAGANPEPAPDGTPAGNAWIMQPSALALGRDGSLFIFEKAGCRIRRIDPAGLIHTVAGNGICAGVGLKPIPVLPALPQLVGMSVDSAGRVYGYDFDSIIRADPSGFVGLIGLVSRPQAVADALDRVVILQSTSISVSNPDGTFHQLALPAYTFNTLGTDPGHNVYAVVTPGSAASVLVQIGTDGTYKPLYDVDSSQLGMAIDNYGNTYSQYSYFTPAGALDPLIPTAVTPAVAPSGDVYAAGGNSIYRMTGTRPPAPLISPGGVVNSLSYDGSGIASGELLSIFGSNFGTATLVASPVRNTLGLSLGGIRVVVAGNEAAILSVSPNQINLALPTGIGLLPQIGNVDIQVQYDLDLSNRVSVPVLPTAFGIATADQSGSGPVAALNQNGTVNSSANPAPPGSVVALFGAGAALLHGAEPGVIAVDPPYSQIANSVTVSIGNLSADVLYAGQAPSEISGVVQINVRIPNGLASGSAPVAVTIGGALSAQKVTIFVR